MKSSLVGLFFIALNAIGQSIVFFPGRSQAAIAEIPPEVTQLAADNTAFALDLYARLGPEHADENLFFSPYSISTALAMTYIGARGETAVEMARVLHFSLGQNQLHPAFSQLMTTIETAPSSDYQILSANRLWGQDGAFFEPQFLGQLQQYYGGEVETLDFINQTEICRQTINDWVEERTQDKIQDPIAPNKLTSLTRFVLTNAIYFQGNWLAVFDPERTRDATFTTASGEQANVSMMYQREYFEYAEVEGLQILELPYRGDALSMVVLLPDAVGGLAALERRFTPDNLQQWLSALTLPVEGPELMQIQLWLPKFRVTSEFDLTKVLSMMGMPSAFGERSDFSGINGGRDLFISDVIHKAVVEVSEIGTEAAAATAIGGVTRGVPPSIEFRADRPFVFLIRHRHSGSILFLGRVANPLESS